MVNMQEFTLVNNWIGRCKTMKRTYDAPEMDIQEVAVEAVMAEDFGPDWETSGRA